jgi:hypothetical protein
VRRGPGDVETVLNVGSAAPRRSGDVRPEPDPQAGPAVLLRRLARLDVVICRQDREPVTVRSAGGATATVRAGRWSPDQIRALLTELGLSAAAFRDSR